MAELPERDAALFLDMLFAARDVLSSAPCPASKADSSYSTLAVSRTPGRLLWFDCEQEIHVSPADGLFDLRSHPPSLLGSERRLLPCCRTLVTRSKSFFSRDLPQLIGGSSPPSLSRAATDVLGRVKLLILDDWGPETLSPHLARDFLDYRRGSLRRGLARYHSARRPLACTTRNTDRRKSVDFIHSLFWLA
jgi:hypothetical protein